MINPSFSETMHRVHMSLLLQVEPDIANDVNDRLTTAHNAAVQAARDSEQNRMFAVLRHLGIKHDTKEIMKVCKEWDIQRTMNNGRDTNET